MAQFDVDDKEIAPTSPQAGERGAANHGQPHIGASTPCHGGGQVRPVREGEFIIEGCLLWYTAGGYAVLGLMLKVVWFTLIAEEFH